MIYLYVFINYLKILLNIKRKYHNIFKICIYITPLDSELEVKPLDVKIITLLRWNIEYTFQSSLIPSQIKEKIF